jgi:hypothetical protein
MLFPQIREAWESVLEVEHTQIDPRTGQWDERVSEYRRYAVLEGVPLRAPRHVCLGVGQLFRRERLGAEDFAGSPLITRSNG